MPFYTYHCPDCQKSFDLQRNVGQRDDATECPSCECVNSARSLALPVVFSLGSDGQVRMLNSPPSCGSCVSTSCGSCGIN